MPPKLISERFTRTYAPWVALLTFFWSVGVGFTQYLQDQRSHYEQTVSRVFEMSKEYRGGFIDVDVKLSDEWKNYVRNSIHLLPSAEVQKQYPTLVSKFLANPDTRTLYVKLGFFYNSLGECVKARLCDFDTANDMFGDEILTYYHNMYPDLVTANKLGFGADGIFDFIAKKKAAHR